MENYDKLLKQSKFWNAIQNINSKKEDVKKDTVKLNIGAGPNIFPYDGWINYDHEEFSSYFNWVKTTEGLVPGNNWQLDGPGSLNNLKKLQDYLRSEPAIKYEKQDLRKQFNHEDNSVDLIYVGQVIEHLNPIHEAPQLIAECYRMMAVGGVIRLTTPDLDLLINAYLNGNMDKFKIDQPVFYKTAEPAMQLSYIMFGATGPNCTFNHYEGHMCMYNKSSITTLLKNAGFKNIEFYYELGKSKNNIMQKEAVDAGISHSFIVEAVK